MPPGRPTAVNPGAAVAGEVADGFCGPAAFTLARRGGCVRVSADEGETSRSLLAWLPGGCLAGLAACGSPPQPRLTGRAVARLGQTDARAPRRGAAAGPPGLAEPLTCCELEVLRAARPCWPGSSPERYEARPPWGITRRCRPGGMSRPAAQIIHYGAAAARLLYRRSAAHSRGYRTAAPTSAGDDWVRKPPAEPRQHPEHP